MAALDAKSCVSICFRYDGLRSNYATIKLQ